ncbi:uncharacterized protein LOC135232287 [Loxodonta africana]|uniref:uncharacterized protein LOC135232287 n=1 Tax=Loxodonta africana TaxID=9785 RepID=UPI0030D00D83
MLPGFPKRAYTCSNQSCKCVLMWAHVPEAMGTDETVGKGTLPPLLMCTKPCPSKSSSPAQPTMGSRLHRWVALCFLGAGESLDTNVCGVCACMVCVYAQYMWCVCVCACVVCVWLYVVSVCVVCVMCVSVCLCGDSRHCSHSVPSTCLLRSQRCWTLPAPKHRVTKRGQTVAIRCDPISGHAGLFWYRQIRGQGLVLLTYFQNKDEADKSGMPKDWFSVEKPDGSSSTLRIQAVEPGDLAVYLCASSLATAWHGHLLPSERPGPGTLGEGYPNVHWRRGSEEEED